MKGHVNGKTFCFYQERTFHMLIYVSVSELLDDLNQTALAPKLSLRSL